MFWTCSSEIRVELKVNDPCWFYKSEDPVLTCTVNSADWYIYWRRDDGLIGMSGIPVGNDLSHYNITKYTNSTVMQERLGVSGSILNSSWHHNSQFRCESQGFFSRNVNIPVPGMQQAFQLHLIITSSVNLFCSFFFKCWTRVFHPSHTMYHTILVCKLSWSHSWTIIYAKEQYFLLNVSLPLAKGI